MPQLYPQLVKAVSGGAVEPARVYTLSIANRTPRWRSVWVLAPTGFGIAVIFAGRSLVARLARWRGERMGPRAALGNGPLAFDLLALGHNAFVPVLSPPRRCMRSRHRQDKLLPGCRSLGQIGHALARGYRPRLA